MLRRNFLIRCGCAAASTLLLPVLPFSVGALQAAGTAASTATQMTSGDRALLKMLSVYGADVYFWGSAVFARATGVTAAAGTTVNLLVRVDDFLQLAAFLRSDAPRALGRMRSEGSTLSFAYRGTAYTVTNLDGAAFASAVAGGGVSKGRTADGTAALARFTSQAMLYHPSTDTLVDPHLALGAKHIDLTDLPSGSLKTQFHTLLQGWLESRATGLKLGKKFRTFQNELLASQPTEKAAYKVVQTLLEDLSALAVAYNVDDLSTLLLSPLVSASLKSDLGVDAADVVAQVEKLRTELASGDYSDAALWLATLLATPIKNGTEGEWLDLATTDAAANAANSSALAAARRLVQTR